MKYIRLLPKTLISCGFARVSLWTSVPRRSKLYIACSDFYKNQSALTPLLLLSAKSHAWLTCSVVNALATFRCRYQLFAGSNPHKPFMLAAFLLNPLLCTFLCVSSQNQNRYAGLWFCFCGVPPLFAAILPPLLLLLAKSPATPMLFAGKLAHFGYGLLSAFTGSRRHPVFTLKSFLPL